MYSGHDDIMSEYQRWAQEHRVETRRVVTPTGLVIREPPPRPEYVPSPYEGQDPHVATEYATRRQRKQAVRQARDLYDQHQVIDQRRREFSTSTYNRLLQTENLKTVSHPTLVNQMESSEAYRIGGTKDTKSLPYLKNYLLNHRLYTKAATDVGYQIVRRREALDELSPEARAFYLESARRRPQRTIYGTRSWPTIVADQYAEHLTRQDYELPKSYYRDPTMFVLKHHRQRLVDVIENNIELKEQLGSVGIDEEGLVD